MIKQTNEGSRRTKTNERMKEKSDDRNAKQS